MLILLNWGTKKMRLTNKLVKDTLVEAIGEDVLKIVDYLKNRKNISEFIIAEKTETEIHAVRNILYRLQRLNLATYKRKKDSKKGYYISYWTYHPKRIKDLIGDLRKSKLEMLRTRLEREEANKNAFFICQNACVRLDFDQATDLEFRCPECGAILLQQDNSRTIDVLRERIKEIEAVA
jgi:transcription initiation factor TFIIE subunit alpha